MMSELTLGCCCMQDVDRQLNFHATWVQNTNEETDQEKGAQDARNVFKELDLDGDQKLTASEWDLIGLGKRNFSDADKNNDGDAPRTT